MDIGDNKYKINDYLPTKYVINDYLPTNYMINDEYDQVWIHLT